MKRLLSVLLALVMALGLLATTAWADETHSHCVCGTTGTVNGHTTHTIENWQPWPAEGATTPLPTTAGNYYLTDNVTLTSRWTVNANISLCLNGHTITANNSGSDTEYILVERATLNLTDCKTTGKITSTDPSTAGQKVVVVACWAGSELNMYGGTITGINVKDITYYSGGGVHNEGIFNMYGGTITGNTAMNGGGVGNWTNAGQNGHVIATFNFYGGTISGNTSTDDVSDAAYFDGGTVNIAGGTINGKIKVNGTNTITGVIRGDVEISGLDNKYTVTFNTSGGSAVASQTLIGTDVKAVEPTAPTKEGYTFVGWVNDDGTPYNFELTVNNDLTLTAVWEEIPAPEGHTHTRRQPAATTTNTDTTVTDTTKADTVTSAKTFDMGVMVYGVMAAASVLGMGYVGKKRG